MELNFTGQAMQFGCETQASLYETVQENSDNPLVRLGSSFITTTSLLIGVVARVASIVESIFKGVANILLGAVTLNGGKIWTGVAQLVKSPIKTLQFPLLEIVEVVLGTFGLFVDPYNCAETFRESQKMMYNALEYPKNDIKPLNWIHKYNYILYR